MSSESAPDPVVSPSTLVALLRWRAQNQPDRLAYRFIGDDGAAEATVTYRQLDQQARAIGARLQLQSAPGERALLLYPPGLEFIAAFFGCMYAGVIAVPAYPPRLNRPMPRLQGIVSDAQATVGLTVKSILSNLERRFEHEPQLASLRWMDTAAIPTEAAADWREPAVTPDTLAFLQYTSGSTSTPKGVMLSHDNLMHNLEVIREGFQIDPAGVGVFWLPSYHDMGFIGGILEPMYVGGPSTLLAPAAFLQRPARWLEAITRFRGTITGAPNFAYDLCVDKITEAERAGLDLSSLYLAFCGAEPVRRNTLDRFAEAFAPCGFRREMFYPCYGLAEATLLVSGGIGPAAPAYYTVQRTALQQGRAMPAFGAADGGQTMVGCGSALLDQQIVIVDPDSLKRCQPDEVGEVWVAGGSVARGYWNRPEETEQSFRAHLAESGEGPFLRTGDLGFVHEGQLYIAGRLKDLIILHGRNHYPQDIELTAEKSHPALQPGAGAAFTVELKGQEQLAIVYEIARQSRKANVDEVAAAIRRAVALEHDVQVHAVVLVKPLSVPKTSSGKVQRFACRASFLEGTLDVVAEWRTREPSAEPVPTPEGAQWAAKPGEPPAYRSTAEISAWLVTQIAARLNVPPSEIDVREPFTSYGLSSVRAVSLAGDLGDWLGQPLAPTLAWDYPTVESLAAYLGGEADEAPERKASPHSLPEPPGSAVEPIAIVGLGCRFPGAADSDEFWRHLRDGVDAITEVPADRWDVEAYYDADPAQPGKAITRWGGFLGRVDLFDAGFFGISPREAARMDPQQRLLMEVAWEALENAGQPPEGLAGSQTGVFIGISSYDYSHLQFDDPTRLDAYAGTGNAHSVAANRLSYFLDLRGPSLAVDTACSSSLVAVHLACQSLRLRESDLALAGGVNVILTPELTITFSMARMMAADGRCKTFDARADGYVRGEGCGIAVLKRLAEAVRDGNHILAVIRGTAVNQDGQSNGLTAPNGLAQQDVIRRALQNAGISAGQLGYVEAHGTGTPLGDPIEVHALREVLDAQQDGRNGSPTVLGSVKTNIGHLEAAAGIAGLIKVVLALQHEEIPPHLHLKEINPYLPLEGAPLVIATERRLWPRGGSPRLAGVSSFGFGGTNAHVVVEEAPAAAARTSAPGWARPMHLLALSAKNEPALRALARRYEQHLASHPAEAVEDVCHSANTGRAHFEHRLAVTAVTTEALRLRLAAFAGATKTAGLVSGRTERNRRPKVAFLFTGQGSQYPGMGRQLYEAQPTFRAALDRCAEILRPRLGQPLSAVLYPEADAGLLHDTAYTQPAIFALQYALYEMWRSWGIEPDAVMGHSVGEFAAACAAGTFSLEDGLSLIAERGRLMQAMPRDGVMFAILADEARVAAALDAEGARASIAAVNGPESIVISGAERGVRAVVERLQAGGIKAQQLIVSHAFHSPLMDPMLDEFERAASRLNFGAPRIPFVSNLTGGRLEPGAIPTANYWRRHAREAVKFAAGLRALAEEGCEAFVELGPNPVLLGMAQNCLPARQAASLAWLPTLKQGQDDWETALTSLGELYVRGANVDWAGFDRDLRPARRIPLPTYPFQRERYWLEPSRAGRRPLPLQLAGEPEADEQDGREPTTKLPAAGGSLTRAALLGAPLEERPALAAAYLQEEGARLLGLEPGRLDLGQPLNTLGLDSLMATQLKNVVEIGLGVALPIVNYLQGPSIGELAGQVLAQLASPGEAAARPPIIAATGDARRQALEHPLSYNQQALWFLHQLAPEDVSFNVAGAVRIHGRVDPAALRRAIQRLVERHAALRTTFTVASRPPAGPDSDLFVASGHPVQRVRDLAEAPFEEIDASAWSEAELHRELAQAAYGRFDLVRGPILRAKLFALSPERHVLALAMDHLASDFWSMAILAQECGLLYLAESAGVPVSLPTVDLQYTDYVRWQAEMLAGPEGERLWAYWQKQLAGELPVLTLPTNRPRPAVHTYHSDSIRLQLGADLAERVRSLGRAHGATLYMTLLAAFQTLLYRYSGQEDLVVGSVTSGRSRPELAGLVGYFINPIALRANLSGNPTFAAFLGQVRETVLGAFDHQDFPPALLAERLHLARDASRPPLFQAMFILQKAQLPGHEALAAFALGLPGARLEVGELTLEAVPLQGQPDQFDLTLMMAEAEAGLAASLHFNTDLFDSTRMRCLLEQYEVLLASVTADPEQPVASIPLLTGAERRQLIVDWNDTRVDFPVQCVHQLIEAQASRTPDSLAVIFEGERLTYRQLNQRANQLAHHLRRLGVRPDTLVGICVDRSLEMMVGLLGILKAGGAYVPFDPAYPRERVAFMLADAGVAVLLTQKRLVPQLPEHQARVVCLDSDWPSIAERSRRKPANRSNPDNLAYVIYTSGSTGKPKGVQVPHSAVANFLHSMRRRPGMTAKDRLLAVTTLSFDIAGLELWLPLAVGAAVVLASRETATNGALLLDRLTSSGATVMQATPATWRLMLEAGWQGGERLKILCGGEALPRELADQLLARGATVWNLYGPTETTIWSTLQQVSVGSGPVSIGRPIANTQVYVLDPHLAPVPVGMVGDLYIGGAGVSRGYLNRPELTAEKFITNPFDPTASTRLYHTGDLARWLPDGSIEFLGRADQQVKVRGFRVELGEIEAALSSHPGIREAAVVAREDVPGEKRLVGYLVPKEGEALPDTSELRVFLNRSLPDYMAPALYVSLESLPLTPNGKVNRRALPAPAHDRPELHQAYVAPRTPLEQGVAAIFGQVLSLDRVGIHDNFFDLGGHSLLATRLVVRLREEYGTPLLLRALFETPTVAGLSEIIESGGQILGANGRQPASLFGAMTLEDLQAEATLDAAITAEGLERPGAGEPAQVCLTGATGFIGAFLLKEILRQTQASVVCLVRAPNLDEARRRIESNLQAYSIWDEALAARILPILGDLSRPLLGLSAEKFEELAGQVDAIYHNGALANFIYPYRTHKAPNVLATQEALRLACRVKLKPVHFVSTLDVFHTGHEQPDSTYFENCDLDEIGVPFGGYAQSKWVGEKLVEIAAARGIPTAVYRPGSVTGDSRTGAWNTGDIICSLAKASVTLGSVPDLDVLANVVPVDYVSRAVVHISRQPDCHGKTYHLANPEPLPFRDVVEWCVSAGYPLQTVEFDQWRTGLLNLAARLPVSGWNGFLPLIEEVEQEQITMPRFDCSNTLAALAGTAIACTPLGPGLLETYMNYLTGNGFLPAPRPGNGRSRTPHPVRPDAIP